jgi:hypothetical protein
MIEVLKGNGYADFLMKPVVPEDWVLQTGLRFFIWTKAFHGMDRMDGFHMDGWMAFSREKDYGRVFQAIWGSSKEVIGYDQELVSAGARDVTG